MRFTINNIKTAWLLPAVILGLYYTDCLSQEFNVMSLNIRLETASDGEDQWKYRRDDLAGTIQKYKPALLGVQEALYPQVTYLDSALVSFRYAGVGRDDGEKSGEFSAIFYDTTVFKCLWDKTVWLSETPDIPSKAWDAAYVRICTYGIFMHHETEHLVLVLNTHYDHVGEAARAQSSRQIIDMTRQLVDEFSFPVILMGDFNAEKNEEPIQTLTSYLTDALTASTDPLHGPEGTFNGFDVNVIPERRIDYVFVKDVEVEHYIHVNDKTSSGRWISDHLPVVAMISMK